MTPTKTNVVTDDNDIIRVLKNQRITSIRIADGIVTQITFENGAIITGGMLVEGPPPTHQTRRPEV